MFDICHPTYYHMSQLGCNDQVKLSTAFYVYMELCEVKRYWDVNYKYSDALSLYYLEARKKKSAKLDTFIPWPAHHNLTLDFISNMQQELEREKFTFVFKDGDTTSVYYSISAGIVKPIAPEETAVIKQKEEKKFALEREINRNTANLYERALLLNGDENFVEEEGKTNDSEIHHTDDQETAESIKNNSDDSAQLARAQSPIANSPKTESLNNVDTQNHELDNEKVSCEME
ncbi:uncharacterized protein LOC106647081 [Copidosoma floridanum]|uniref:uncharacterized protein LOC106647081 n=1 Tax=Copidosoma floridanum TaxID=29053 RepID=UPI0006C9BC49|nr:uncharacterized protein LOC106647081 [Copidosoma floridanum]